MPVIEFPEAHRVMFERDVIAFPADVDGAGIECRISYEALMSRFGSRPGEKQFEQTFIRDRAAIQELARRLIGAGRVGRDRILRINS